MRIEFNVGPILDALAEARASLDDMKPAYEDIGEFMVKATRERFLTGTAPDGTRWRQKSPTTLAEYTRRGDLRQLKVLTDKQERKTVRATSRGLKSGQIFRPLIGPSGRLGKEIHRLATRDSVEVGSALEYSAVMQGGAAKGAFGTASNGAPTPWGDIPARPFIGISESDGDAIVRIVDDHLRKAFD